MKILITGSSGFIGFHLAKKLLEKGHKIHGFDSMNSYYDVRLKKNLERSFKTFKPQIVIHLAAQAGVRYSIKKPRVYLDSNITGTYNVIEASNKFKVKHLIMASSSSVYGANKKFPFKEIFFD